jgi:hypothetical protein
MEDHDKVDSFLHTYSGGSPSKSRPKKSAILDEIFRGFHQFLRENISEHWSSWPTLNGNLRLHEDCEHPSSERGGVRLINVEIQPPPASSIVCWQRINRYALFLREELTDPDFASSSCRFVKCSVLLLANLFRLHVVLRLISLQIQLTVHQADN